MYRDRKRCSKKLSNMRAAKERKRLDGPAPDYLPELPDLRRKLEITDYDFGEVSHVIECYRSDRIDCYKVYADGKLWLNRVGWAKTLEMVRKTFIRVGSH